MLIEQWQGLSKSIKNSPAWEECELTGVSARAVTLHVLSGAAALSLATSAAACP